MNLISSIVVSSSADFMYNDSFDQKMQTEVWEAVSNRAVSMAWHGMAQRGTWSSILSKVWESWTLNSLIVFWLYYMYLYFLCVWFWKALAQAVLLPMSWHKRLGVLAHLHTCNSSQMNPLIIVYDRYVTKRWKKHLQLEVTSEGSPPIPLCSISTRVYPLLSILP